MPVTVRIPPIIGRLYGAGRYETVEAESVADLLVRLDERFPGLGERLMEPGGIPRRWVNIFVDGKDIRDSEGMQTQLADGAEVYIVPAVAGG